MGVKPGIIDLDIYRGARKNVLITCYYKGTTNPVDLTGKKARAQFRRTKNSTTILAYIDTETLGGITLGGVNGTINMVLTAQQTKVMAASGGYWDIEIYTTEDDVDRYFEGALIMDPEVTRG